MSAFDVNPLPGATFGGLGIALKLISTEDLQAIANMAKGFSDFARNISSEFVMAMKAIGDFVDAVDDIGSSDVKVFASLRKEIVPLLSSPVNPGVGKEMQGTVGARGGRDGVLRKIPGQADPFS